MITTRWSPVPLGQVLRKSDVWITPDPTEQYRELTVRLWGKGVVERRTATGAEISGRRLVARAGQFILSRIDARNGAFGIIPDHLDGALVSNDFPVFDLDTTRLLPAYLGWLTRTRDFVDLCRAASEGTTNRVRLKEDRFLTMTIQLPPLDEQRRIVARIEALAAKVEEVRGLRQEAIRETTALLMSTERAVLGDESGCPWPTRPLVDVCLLFLDCDHKTPAYTEKGVALLRPRDVRSGHLDLSATVKIDEQDHLARC